MPDPRMRQVGIRAVDNSANSAILTRTRPVRRLCIVLVLASVGHASAPTHSPKSAPLSDSTLLPQCVGSHPCLYIPMEAGIRPMTYLCHAPMLHRVSMDVIDMPVEARLIFLRRAFSYSRRLSLIWQRRVPIRFMTRKCGRSPHLRGRNRCQPAHGRDDNRHDGIILPINGAGTRPTLAVILEDQHRD
jgi:hypothetical protein